MSDKPILTLDDFMDAEKQKTELINVGCAEQFCTQPQDLHKKTNEECAPMTPWEEIVGGDAEIPYVTMENFNTFVSSFLGEFSLKCRPSGTRKSKWKNKLFVSATNEDCLKYIDQICEWTTDSDVDVYYNDIDDFDEKVYDHLVSQMNAMIVIVTNLFLSTSCRAKSIDIKLAKKYGIPVIPIYFDGSIYSFNEQFGNIELIKVSEGDFVYKIQKHLQHCMTNERLFTRIKQEFKKNVFLSYRKKDVNYARDLLSILRDDERFWDVSIWYDDYLTPGEDYDDEIETQISTSSVFLILATPNLLEKDNYVQKYEYPYACSLNKSIVAVEAQKVDVTKIRIQFNDLPDLLEMGDHEQVIEAIVDRINFEQCVIGDEIEHKYYIALAYYWGIGVHRDVKYALRLMIDCVAQNHIPSIYFIASVPIFHECLSIEKKIEVFEYAIRELEKELLKDDFSNLYVYWTIAYNLTTTYYSARKYLNQIELLEKMSSYCEQISQRNATIIEEKSRISFRLAMAYEKIGNCEANTKETLKAVKLVNMLMKMDIANKPYSLYLLISICLLKQLAKNKDFEQYEKEYKHVCDLYNALDDKTQKAVSFEYAQYVQNYATYLFTFADYTAKDRAYDVTYQAIRLFSDSYEKEMSKSLISSLYSLLASQYFQDRNVEKAIETAEKAVDFAKEGKQYNKAFADELLAKNLFNCANICFQFDVLDKAEQYFIETINLCSSNINMRNVEIFRYACDYYAQLLVASKRYDEAVEKYVVFVNSIVEAKIDWIRVYEFCAQFCYRISIIALNYLNNEELAIVGINNAMSFIDGFEQPSEEMLKLRQEMLHLFG